MNLCATTVLVTACVAFSMLSGTGHALSDDEAKIETLENSFIAAFNAKDVDAIMKRDISGASLVVFDLTLPRQYLGADTYGKDWQDFFAILRGPPKVWITTRTLKPPATSVMAGAYRKSKAADVIPRTG